MAQLEASVCGSSYSVKKDTPKTLNRVGSNRNTKKMAKKNQHVIPHNNKWAVKGENNQKVTKTFDNKQDAVEYAKGIAKKQQSELIIHKGDGTIQDKNSFGNDPNPPKDKK
jgi:uncharacterized protein YdaT